MFTKSPVKINKINSLFISYYNTFQEKGYSSVPESARDFFRKFRRSFIALDKYYLYEKKFNKNTPFEIIESRVEDVIMKVLFLPISIEQYEILGEKKYDFRKYPEQIELGDITKRGTYVFLGIKENSVIYRSCISNYRNGVYQAIYPGNNNKNITYQGFNWTHPNFRKMGLYTWAQTYMFDFISNLGYEKIVMLEPEDQVGPRKVQDRLGSQFLCESFAFRLLLIINYRYNKYTNE